MISSINMGRGCQSCGSLLLKGINTPQTRHLRWRSTCKNSRTFLSKERKHCKRINPSRFMTKSTLTKRDGDKTKETKQGLLRSWMHSFLRHGPVPPNFYLRHENTILKYRCSGPQVRLGLGGFTIVNACVYIMWWRPAEAEDNWLQKHFTCNYNNLKEGRLWTLVTCTMSHEHINHFMANVMSLWVFGFRTYRTMGHKSFWTLFLLGGIASSSAHVAQNILHGNTTPPLSKNGWLILEDHIKNHGEESLPEEIREEFAHIDIPLVGASGSIMAVAAASAALFPGDRITIHPIYTFLFLPLPLAVANYALLDFSGLIGDSEKDETTKTIVAHGSHLAGMVVGALYIAAAWRMSVKPAGIPSSFSILSSCCPPNSGKDIQLPIVYWLKRLL